MDKDWLERRLTIEEAEARNMVQDNRLGNEAVPFGFMNKEWKTLVARIVEGDELWEFNSPEDTWQNLCGRAGIALVRNGEVIDAIVTFMN
jgi:hypothetical protein